MSQASRLIRDSIAALPPLAQNDWPRAAQVRPDIWADEARKAIRAHIALLASPHVAAAVADLLEARHRETVVLADYQAVAGGTTYAEVDEARHALTRAFAALEAAITRAGGS